mmetsp:Transcript_150620/g.280770  ORF Transcript_150620/g.280770 Transcript_150620/m.280770 type:complete len:429 (-) Transcript_150620:25-1311(-)
MRFRPDLSIDIPPRREVLRPPLITQKYELLEIMGQGTTAVVRRAMHRGSAQIFAVKTVHTEDPEMAAIVAKEFELLKSVQHPNIVQVVELVVDLTVSRVDIVMALVSGLRLDALVKRNGCLTEDGARPLLVQLLRAVRHCHSHRVCHRDIKPENIMISLEAGCPQSLVLMDFNAACRGGGLTPTGTRLYMSPEAWCEAGNTNEMRDMWSVGVCLFFMLAGFLPWIGERLHVLALEVSNFPLRLPAGLSTEADSLLQGLLCRVVACRLMVIAALAHPWCRLAPEERRELFGIQGSDDSFSQPSYFNWEVKARKSSGVEAAEVEDVQGSAEQPFRKTASWPMVSSTVETVALHEVLMQESNVPAGSTSPPWYTYLPQAKSRASVVSPSFRGWELRMRRSHLQDLYGEPIHEPPYRNWEINARRKLLQVSA